MWKNTSNLKNLKLFLLQGKWNCVCFYCVFRPKMLWKMIIVSIWGQFWSQKCGKVVKTVKKWQQIRWKTTSWASKIWRKWAYIARIWLFYCIFEPKMSWKMIFTLILTDNCRKKWWKRRKMDNKCDERQPLDCAKYGKNGCRLLKFDCFFVYFYLKCFEKYFFHWFSVNFIDKSVENRQKVTPSAEQNHLLHVHNMRKIGVNLMISGVLLQI